MKKYASSLFPDDSNLFDRFDSLQENDPFTELREKFLRNYNRRDWRVVKRGETCRTEPNFGQFKFKIDAAIGAFIMILTERKDWIKVEPKYPEPGIQHKPFSERVSSAFHKYFIRRWPKRFMMEAHAAFDMVMYGKAIEFWPSPGCVYTENIPVENVFPDSNAGMDTEKWSYVFIRKEFTVAELRAIYETKENKVLEDFDKKYLKQVIDWLETYASPTDSKEAKKMTGGEQASSVRDMKVSFVYAFVKDNFTSEKKVSCYVFHADLADYVQENRTKAENGNMPHTRLIMMKDEYCECISQVLAVRAFQLTRSYWKFNSLAQQIYLATQLYDQSMNLMLRLSKRHAILYLKSSSPDTQKKLMRQTDSEVQVVDSDVDFVQLGNQNSNIREIMEVTRQVMIDTENGQSITQAPGSQNTKGYAITAEEARLRSQQEGESQILSFKVLMNQDVSLYSEIYRRAMEGDDEDHKKGLTMFKKEMTMYNVDSSYYDFDDVYFVPSFTNGGSQFARLSNANAILEILSKQPIGMGQEQAQREAIAALVGVDNVDQYIQEKTNVNPVILKAGRENEDLDNPHVNPMNVPVLPDDKHLQEIPIHIADYEQKLKKSQVILQVASQYPNNVKKLFAVMMAADLIAAQDLKGAHIEAHVQAASNSKENMDQMKDDLAKLKGLQGMQDQLTKQVTQLTEELDKLMAQGAIQDVELDHKKAMYAADLEYKKQSDQIALGKQVSQAEMAKERSASNYAEKENQAVLTSATKQAQAEADLTNKQLKDEQAIEAEKRKSEAKLASAGGTGKTSS